MEAAWVPLLNGEGMPRAATRLRKLRRRSGCWQGFNAERRQEKRYRVVQQPLNNHSLSSARHEGDAVDIFLLDMRWQLGEQHELENFVMSSQGIRR